MSRPKGDDGRALPAAHIRLPRAEAAIGEIYMALCQDGTCAHLEAIKKIRLAEKAIDHVVDGGKPPAWLWGPTEEERAWGGGGLGERHGLRAESVGCLT